MKEDIRSTTEELNINDIPRRVESESPDLETEINLIDRRDKTENDMPVRDVLNSRNVDNIIKPQRRPNPIRELHFELVIIRETEISFMDDKETLLIHMVVLYDENAQSTDIR
jgi:hypothetical protein